MAGPVGRTRQGKTFLVRKQVDDVPPCAEKPKKVDANTFQRLNQKKKKVNGSLKTLNSANHCLRIKHHAGGGVESRRAQEQDQSREWIEELEP